MVAFHTAHVGVHREPTGKGNSQIVAKGAELAALILKIVDELRVLAIFPRENVAELEDRRVEGGSTMALEDIGDGAENAIAEQGVGPGPVLRALRGLQVERGGLVLGHLGCRGGGEG